MGDAADEADATAHAITFASPDDPAPGQCRPQLIYPHVERRLVTEMGEADPDGHARRHVHQADDRSRGEHAGLRDADQLLAVIEAELDPVRAVAEIEDAERAAMADAARISGESLRIEGGQGLA